MRNFAKRGAILLTLAALSLSCSSTLSLAPSPTNSPTPSQTPKDTTTPTVTYTSTSSPTPTVTPTWTPLPTIPVTERLDLIKDLLTTNGGCQLPCWWGITPGKTTWTTARQFLETFVSVIHEHRNDGKLTMVEVLPADSNVINPYEQRDFYYLTYGVIEWMQVYPGNVETYFISKVLLNLGKPDEVLVESFSQAREGDQPFLVFLFYRKQGVYTYYSTQALDLGNKVRGCFDAIPAGRIVLWNADLRWDFEDVDAHSFNVSLSTNLLSLMDGTGLDIEAFYQMFTQPTASKCLEIPKGKVGPP